MLMPANFQIYIPTYPTMSVKDIKTSLNVERWSTNS